MILTLFPPITTQQPELHLFVVWQNFVYSLKKDTNILGYLRVNGDFGLQKVGILHNSVDWDNFSILDSDKNYKSRKAKESIYINSLVGGGDSVNSIMNLEKGPCKLDSCWNRVYPMITERVQNKLQRQHKKWLWSYE